MKRLFLGGVSSRIANLWRGPSSPGLDLLGRGAGSGHDGAGEEPQIVEPQGRKAELLQASSNPWGRSGSPVRPTNSARRAVDSAGIAYYIQSELYALSTSGRAVGGPRL
jgi:hypothetical protein